jgi:hypothetical protein
MSLYALDRELDCSHSQYGGGGEEGEKNTATNATHKNCLKNSEENLLEYVHVDDRMRWKITLRWRLENFQWRFSVLLVYTFRIILSLI